MKYRLDPEGFVEVMYPWGKAHTPLAEADGPRSWHRGELRRIRDHVCRNEELVAAGKVPLVYKSATASGHGIGKSTLVTWESHWFMSTRLGGCVNIAANSEDQLRKKTFAEIGKWFALALNKDWFEVEGLSVKASKWWEKHLRDQLGIDSAAYGINGVTWSEDRTESIQGTHNGVGVMWIIDEASAVPKPVWTAINPGSFTEKTKSRFFIAYSNFTRNQGEFYDCFYAPGSDWLIQHIDSRKVEGVDTTELDKLVAKYGENHDEVRIRVRGLPPQFSEETFIPVKTAREAKGRNLELDRGAAKILGVDPAPRGGTSSAAIREGRHVTKIQTAVFDDNVPLASWVARIIDEEDPDAVFIDAGNGTGVIDILRSLGYKVIEVWFGGLPEDEKRFADRRTEMWDAIREWLPGGSLPMDDELETQLIGPLQEWTGRSKTVQKLESKRQMRARGLPSPDKADSVALTFAQPVVRKDRRGRRGKKRPDTVRDMDHAVFT